MATIPSLSVTVAVSVKLPAWVGVPEIAPVGGFTVSRGAGPLVEHRAGGVPRSARSWAL